MSGFDRFFHGEHGAARSYLLARLFLSLFALDIWLLMIEGAGRYGIGGFNVAHFAWLDRLLPVPSPGLYVATLLLTGLLSLVLALTGVRCVAGLALCALYTLSWSISMLDSYQHHYLLSLILLCIAFFPPTRAVELQPVDGDQSAAEHGRTPGASRAPLLQTGFGYGLLGATMAIVYVYSAIAKMDAQWIGGFTLQRIVRFEHWLALLDHVARALGLERDHIFALFATAMILLELFLALAYLLAVPRDGRGRRGVSAVCAVAFAIAVALHSGNEVIGLKIGWFSYYMLLLAFCFFLPLRLVDWLARALTRPARALARAREAAPPRLATLGLAAACALCVAGIGWRLDLPGALLACVLTGAALLAVTVWMFLRPAGGDPRPLAIATAFAAAIMGITITRTPTRFDFYRNLGGDLRRRNELAAALDAYRHAERYAPPGKTRAGRIAELERSLGR